MRDKGPFYPRRIIVGSQSKRLRRFLDPRNNHRDLNIAEPTCNSVYYVNQVNSHTWSVLHIVRCSTNVQSVHCFLLSQFFRNVDTIEKKKDGKAIKLTEIEFHHWFCYELLSDSKASWEYLWLLWQLDDSLIMLFTRPAAYLSHL